MFVVASFLISHFCFVTWPIPFSVLQGSGLIIIDIVRKSTSTSTTYHQLVLAISSFDIISSLAYAVSSLATPREDSLFTAVGNRSTCVAQAFAIQFGHTSIFYNLALCYYFFLVICNNWTEQRCRKVMPAVHTVTIAVGLGLAVAAIPFYGTNWSVCAVRLLFVASFTFRFVSFSLCLVAPCVCVFWYRRVRTTPFWIGTTQSYVVAGASLVSPLPSLSLLSSRHCSLFLHQWPPVGFQ